MPNVVSHHGQDDPRAPRSLCHHFVRDHAVARRFLRLCGQTNPPQPERAPSSHQRAVRRVVYPAAFQRHYSRLSRANTRHQFCFRQPEYAYHGGAIAHSSAQTTPAHPMVPCGNLSISDARQLHRSGSRLQDQFENPRCQVQGTRVTDLLGLRDWLEFENKVQMASVFKV